MKEEPAQEKKPKFSDKATVVPKQKEDPVLSVNGGDINSNAILVTGATHARELLSSQVPLFLALKLIH